ncbi:MAG: IS1634 family transposase [Oscillospiraceae bacterium]|nr:IS1634 family transposase [Oscillospiraceae bacterium]
MAYIKTLKTRDKKTYIYLCESYRIGDHVSSRTIKSLGQLEKLEKDEPNVLERLKREAKEGLLGGTEPKKVIIEYDTEEEINDLLYYYGWLLIDSIYREYQIDRLTKELVKKNKIKYDLNKVLKLLVYGRFLFPSSKSKTVELQSQLYGDWEINQNYMDRSLDYLPQIKDELFTHLHQKQIEKTERSCSLVYYDVTNYYFTNDIDDIDIWNEDTGELVSEGLRKRGCSKEKRPKPIVQMGLFMDENGIPISYKLFPGNTHDCATYIPALEEIKTLFGIDKVIVTADKAMNSKKNIELNNNLGNGWLFSQKVRGKRGIPKDIQEFALDPNGWTFASKGQTAYKSMIHERVINKNCTIKEKVIVTWNGKYALRERIRRKNAVEYVKNLTKPEAFRASCRKGGKRYLIAAYTDPETGEERELNCELKIDDELIEYDSMFDGLNVLVTSELDKSDEQLINHYRQLHLIEDCFRVIKSEFSARPVYVWTKNHIEAHFLICFLALFIMRTMQFKIDRKMSAGKILECLGRSKCDKIGKGYLRLAANKELQKLMKLLDYNVPKKIEKEEKIKNFDRFFKITK